MDEIPGEERGFRLDYLGQGLMTIGFIVLMGGVLAGLLSIPSLKGGWEGVWYIPRGGILFVLPVPLLLVATGALLYFFGRRNGID